MNYILSLVLILFVYMNFLFLISLIKKRNDIADVGWGIGFVLLAWASFNMGDKNSSLGLLVSLLVSVWGLRLAGHIYSRNKGKAEDYRYLEWRKAWGKWFYIRSYAQIYMLQGFLLFLISLPVLVINNSSHIIFKDFIYIGTLLWIIGFYFEVVGDWQLSNFIKDINNKGKLMMSGLWQYTRHPNYFGEVTQWWAIWLMSLSVYNGLISIIGPMTITFLILKVSGVPMLEKKMQANAEFAKYKKQTSMFIPWFVNK